MESKFPLHAEVLQQCTDPELANWTSAVIAELRTRALFNKTYEKIVSSLEHNVRKNAANRAAGFDEDASIKSMSEAKQ